MSAMASVLAIAQRRRETVHSPGTPPQSPKVVPTTSGSPSSSVTTPTNATPKGNTLVLGQALLQNVQG
ncbi:hypothetical protein GWI33_016133 [Rhynchophorus ferrugineus]|uniref:Uncharacterized protein n=1 Tax=Rhynchophorus ferrugineus TaxID=354439 RepID=A0A834HZA7_RHYFE|nr:hypothetical protein GWI33_016133 [Rhynchophorus ferrugineus]